MTELTLAPRHVQLDKTTTVSAVVSSINEMYGESIDATQYEDSLPFVDKDGLLTLHFVDIETGETRWVFKDRYSIERQSQITMIENPKDFIYPQVIKNFAVIVNTEKELEFMKGLRLDVRHDSGNICSDKSRLLARLLNRYNVGDGWSANPQDGNTTAYFMPRYIGPGADAPDVYNFNRDTKLLVVVELMKHGEYETYALTVG